MSADSPSGKAPAPRPEPDALELIWSYVPIYNGDPEYFFDVYRADGSDNVYFVDPRWDPQPYELEGGCLNLGLTRKHMTELRDTLTYLLENWGKREARESHPETED